jgi:NTP pyrophosphatase (non-canonical NTP hydrolase)
MEESKLIEILNELIKGLILERDKASERFDVLMTALQPSGVKTFNDYQGRAAHFAIYPDPVYPALALTEEAGEVAGLVAKIIRKGGTVEEVPRNKLMDELGDVLWNIAALASGHGITMQEIADHNILKLMEREENDEIAERKG